MEAGVVATVVRKFPPKNRTVEGLGFLDTGSGHLDIVDLILRLCGYFRFHLREREAVTIGAAQREKEIVIETKAKCNVCHATGDCTECKGTGNGGQCFNCSGTGKCPHCAGSGRLDADQEAR